VELLPEKSILLHDLDVIDSLLLQANNSPKLVSVLILLVKELVRPRDHTRLLHDFLVLFVLCGKFLVDEGLGLLLSLLSVRFLLLSFNEHQSPLLPFLVVLFVKVKQHRVVVSLEFVDILFVDNHKDCDQHFRAVSVDEIIFLYLSLVNEVAQIFGQKGWRIFFDQLGQLRFDLVCIVSQFLQFVVRVLLCGLNFCSQNLE